MDQTFEEHKQGVEKFRHAIENIINYHRKENMLTYGDVIGTLELIVFDIKTEASHQGDTDGQQD